LFYHVEQYCQLFVGERSTIRNWKNTNLEMKGSSTKWGPMCTAEIMPKKWMEETKREN
jgi:hypothetical protein